MVAIVDGALPVTPRPCGAASDHLLVKSWEAGSGRCPGEEMTGPGVAAVDGPSEAYASRCFTFEAWISWPEGSRPLARPATLAEVEGGEWSWRLEFDRLGSLRFHWRNGERGHEKDLFVSPSFRGNMNTDSLRAGDWYHVALVFFDLCYTKEPYVGDYSLCGLLLTEAGRPLPRWSGVLEHFETTGPGPRAPARISVGGPLGDSEPEAPPPGPRIGSAAFHRCVRSPNDFPALGGAPVPDGILVDCDIDSGSLGNCFALAPDAIVFAAAPRPLEQNYWFAFRVRGAKGRRLTFHNFNGNPMAVTAFVSEDGGRRWARPSDGIWRRAATGYQGHLTFTHTFGVMSAREAREDEVLVAACPIVTTSMASDWIDEAAAGSGGRIHEVGRSREGNPLRVLEIGNPEAPLVYLQGGQHSMMERVGFHLMAAAFEKAAGDSELMKTTRWAVMPVVNVDSYAVHPRPGDRNMNRLWGVDEDHPTVGPIARFVRREVERTGAVVTLDLHAGGVWRGHHLISGTPGGFPELEEELLAAGINWDIRRRDRLPQMPRGSFSDFCARLGGVRGSYTLELAVMSVVTPGGTEAMSLDNLRAEGERWYRAIRRLAGRPGT